MSEGTPREIIRRNITKLLSTIDAEHPDIERDLLTLTVAIQQLLDLDAENQKPPMYIIQQTYPPTYPTWPDSGQQYYHWWDSRNPYKITMTTNTANMPTEFEMTYETPGYGQEDESDREDDGERVPA